LIIITLHVFMCIINIYYKPCQFRKTDYWAGVWLVSGKTNFAYNELICELEVQNDTSTIKMIHKNDDMLSINKTKIDILCQSYLPLIIRKVCTTLGILKIRQHEPRLNPLANTGAPEGWAVPAPHVASVVLFLLQVRW
jgi:hypothetical protein